MRPRPARRAEPARRRSRARGRAASTGGSAAAPGDPRETSFAPILFGRTKLPRGRGVDYFTARLLLFGCERAHGHHAALLSPLPPRQVPEAAVKHRFHRVVHVE